jgi:hypothetical protein
MVSFNFLQFDSIGPKVEFSPIFFFFFGGGGETTHKKKRDNARFGIAYDFTSNKG